MLHFHGTRARSLFLAAMLMPLAAQAATLRVGTGPDCTHADLRAAINEAGDDMAYPGPDEILVNRNAVAPAQALRISGQHLVIRGGYDDCRDSQRDTNDRTVVTGSLHANLPVFDIIGPGVVVLDHLTVNGGHVDGDGAGIRYTSGGADENELVLEETQVTFNVAGGSGGGLFFDARSGVAATLSLREGTAFFDNEADDDGGGVALLGAARLDSQVHRLFFHRNRAGGSGGGLWVRQPATAEIASAEWDDFATFEANEADVGGAIAVEAQDAAVAPATVWLYSLFDDLPASVSRNEADNGAAFAVIGAATAPASARLCIAGYDVRANKASSRGSIAYVSSGTFGNCVDATPPSGSVANCRRPGACNQWVDNESLGSAIFADAGASVDLTDVRLDGSIYVDTLVEIVRSRVTFRGCEITRNESTAIGYASLFFVDGPSELVIEQSTIAANNVDAGAGVSNVLVEYEHGGTPPFATTTITRSILAYDPADSLLVPGFAGYGTVHLSELLTTTRPPREFDGPSIVTGDPAFVSVANGDFHLTPISPAIDFAAAPPMQPAVAGLCDRDRDEVCRGVDHPDVPDRSGPYDLGAYEVPGPVLFRDGFE